MSVLSESRRPRDDQRSFMRAAALNFLIGGTDAHAKNYSLLHAPGGTFRLAPLYDVISALPYEDRHKDRKLAMSVGGEYRYDKIGPSHWIREAEACGYDAEAAVGHVRDLIAKTPDAAADVLNRCREDGLSTESLSHLADAITQRCRALAARYGAEPAEESRTATDGGGRYG